MTNQQTTSTILMIRPVNFVFNEQTAGSNAFQNRNAEQQRVQDKALEEFDRFVSLLRENGVEVIVIDDTTKPHTPDSIFPNNWVSFHNDGTVFLYPMMAENRRLERREDIITQLEDEFKVKHVIDLSHFEHENKFLEGTGSMVLDRENKIAYACLSPRTDKEVLEEFCKDSGYKPVIFHAIDRNGMDIYHTNVLMCIGSSYAVICLDSIKDETEKATVTQSFRSTQKQVVDISFDQMNHFAGNMLEVQNKSGESLLVMSKSAWDSLNYEQKSILSSFSKPLYSDISTIENNGGGSARCMMAEVHLPHNL
ncbi:citrulline utilization hydrolase CtlX [Mucilaginibacter sp. BT774]|uniref:citrulline utilization hydrolase CtlX n=1 Tax=Mucilaginibacter sp. BT774 TaxID=3062276 RepID=UPI002676F9B7|nr:arginine deiminase-related protein [Mucilaginibacter sp. BT774]MDO3628755.1 arginine deiminase-related protein [Mucilaginibacter sp. BT774]